MRHILAPGGRLLLLVPALSCLYGTIDRNLGHFRRYEKSRLATLLKRSGFFVETLRYSNALGTVGWYVNGRLLRRRELSNWQVILFDRFVPLLEAVERRVRPGIGMSLLAVARKLAVV